MKRVEIKQALQMQASDNEITVMGWVRNKRGSKNVAFIALNDGSTINNLQLVIDLNVIPEEKLALMHAGASLWAKGVLVASMGSGQAVELSVKEIGCSVPPTPMNIRCNPRNTRWSSCATSPTCVSAPTPSAPSCVCAMPWCSPSTSSSPSEASIISIRH
jgi:Aspartyl/asparaginyl-tRNA synthetases